jgi:hypothetical protein
VGRPRWNGTRSLGLVIRGMAAVRCVKIPSLATMGPFSALAFLGTRIFPKTIDLIFRTI